MSKFFVFFITAVISWQATGVTITVKNANNKPLANAVVWLTPIGSQNALSKSDALYSMGQKNREFTPHVLVVPQNAKVEFPNDDSIMHHVYSFSKAKTFELKLYKEQPKAPLLFEQTGVVELGCNIHDWMIGYIVVVDSTLFAITDENGHVELAALPAEYKLNVWHSGFNDISNVESQTVKVSQAPLSYKIKQPIREKIDFATDEFDDY